MPTLPPDTSLTYQDIILRVAEECGFAEYDPSSPDSPAAIPSDRQVLDKIKRAVNDGIDRLARAWPKCSALRPQVRFAMAPNADGPLNLPNPITGAADPTIYRLPSYITGRPVGGWQWSSPGSNFCGKAEDADPERVDMLNRSSQTTSYPRLASMVPSPPVGDTGDRQCKAVRFYPAPDQAYLITGRFLVTPAKMVDLNDRHIFGASHDQTVVAFALWSFKEHDAKDPAMRATYQARAERALAESRVIDMEGAANTLGRMADPDVGASFHRYSTPGVDVLTSSMTPVLS